MIESDEVVNQVKKYLNQNAFAGPNFPDEKCAVPKFDFSDLRPAEPAVEESPEVKLKRLRDDLLAKGCELIEDTKDRLVLRGDDNSIILVDKNKAEISVDMTGEYLLKSKP